MSPSPNRGSFTNLNSIMEGKHKRDVDHPEWEYDEFGVAGNVEQEDASVMEISITIAAILAPKTTSTSDHETKPSSSGDERRLL